MQIFEFEDGTKLKVLDVDYVLLQKIAGNRFDHISPNVKHEIDQLRDVLEIDEEGYVIKIKDSTYSKIDEIAQRLVLNQLLKSTLDLKEEFRKKKN